MTYGDFKKLTNFTPEYRLRVGDYRVLFETENDKVTIYRIRHRKKSIDRRYTMKNFKKMPRFKNEGEELEFWSTYDSAEYIEWSKAERA